MSRDPIEQVLKSVRNYELLSPGEAVTVACSGGPDSVFLLHALNRLSKKLKLKEVSVCTLDHGLRGRESAEDVLFVSRLARSLGLRCAEKKVDVMASKAKDLSTEEAAREARYGFFREAASGLSADVVATGHTLDDQAETVLMRILKGASLKGLVGISPVRKYGSMKIIRPILELEKSEIANYLKAEGIGYRVDSTNSEPLYFRNIVRSEILPFLERYNPRVKRSLFNMAEHLREDFEFIEVSRSGASGMISDNHDGSIGLRLKDLVVQARTIQKEILRDCLERAGGDVKKLSFRHWKELESLVNRKSKGSAVHLPGGISVSRSESAIKFFKI